MVIEPRRPGLRAVLAKPTYRRLWMAQTISRWGDVFNTVALAVLVLQLTGSGLGVTGVVVAEILPVLLLAPVAGAVIDRVPKVKVMLAADVWRMLLAAALPLVDHSVVAVYLVAVGLSIGAVFFNPSAQAVLPAVVERDELIAANSALWTGAVLAQILLGPLAGGVVAVLGTAPAFWLNAATYAASAAILVRLAVPHVPPAATGPRANWWTQVTAGIRAIAGERTLRLLATVQLLAALSAGATSALLIVLATDHLGVGPDGFGLLLGAIGVGAVTGPVVLSKLISDPRRPAFVFGPFLLRGVVDLLLAAFRSFPVAIAALGLYGIGTSTGSVTYNSMLQAQVPAPMRGRVFAGFDGIWQFGRLASLAVGGLLTDLVHIRAVYLLGGLLLLLAGTLGLRGLRGPADIG